MEDEFTLEGLNLSDELIDSITAEEEIIDETKVITPEEKQGEENKDEKTEPAPEEKLEADDKSNETKLEVKSTTTTPSSDSEESSTFSVFAKFLNEEGVFDFTEDELKGIKTSDDLKTFVKEHLDKARYADLSEHQIRYLKAVEAGIPEKDFEALEKQLTQLDKITEEVLDGDEKSNLQARFDVIAFNFIEKGFDKDRAIKMANQSIKLGLDKEDAKEALIELKQAKATAYEAAIKEKKEERVVSLDTLKKTVDETKSVLKDYVLTDADKKDVYDILSIKVDTDEAGRSLNKFDKWRKDNGVNAEIVLGTLYKATNGFQDLGKILVKSTSKASLDLEKKLRQNENAETSQTISAGSDDYEFITD